MGTFVPPVTEQWFYLNPDSDDLSNVLNFIENVPNRLAFLLDRPFFADLLNKDQEFGISYQLFWQAFGEASEVLFDELRSFRNSLAGDVDETFRRSAEGTLIRIGFTGNSLILKASVLNKLATNFIRVSRGAINFVTDPIVKAFRKLLTFLNKLFESLKLLIPGIESIKEIKEVAETYVDIADI